MPLTEEARSAVGVLHRIQAIVDGDVKDPKVSGQMTKDLGILYSILQCPVFTDLLKIEDSLTELSEQILTHPSLLPEDFHISKDGSLTLRLPEEPDISDHLSVGLVNKEYSSSDQESDVSSQDVVETSQYPMGDEIHEQVSDYVSPGKDVFYIDLYKPEGSNLGFSLVGLKSDQRGELGIYVQEVQPNGIAAEDGRMREGDQILAVDGQPLHSQMSHQQAIRILQNAQGKVSLVVARMTRSRPSTPHRKTPEYPLISSEYAQVEVVDLVNKGQGLGFGIVGGESTGVIIKTILPGGVADQDGRLQSGDHLLCIGEIYLNGLTSEQVASVLRHAGSHVRLVVARPFEIASQCASFHTPIVPSRILADSKELEKYLLINKLRKEREWESEELSAEEYPSDVESCPEVEMFDVHLNKDSQGLGITIAGYVCEKEGLSGIFVKSVNPGSAAAASGKIQVNDQIVEVDGNSLSGYSNHQAVELLRHTGSMVHLRLARFLRGPKFEQLQMAIAATQPSRIKDRDLSAIKAKWQTLMGPEYEVLVSEILKHDESGGLGISLEGTVDVENGREVRPHHYIRSVLPGGPVGRCEVFESGDELLEVNGKKLLGLNHRDVVFILKEVSSPVIMVCARMLPSALADSHPQPKLLVKAKSDGSIASPPPDKSSPSLLKARSMEPLTGLAMWSDSIVYVDLHKGERGLGFSILDYQNPLDPDKTVVLIRSLVPGGVAQQDGQIIPGDRLMSVNKNDVSNASLDAAVQALKGAPKGIVRLGIAKPLQVSEQDFSITSSQANLLPASGGGRRNPSGLDEGCKCVVSRSLVLEDDRHERGHAEEEAPSEMTTQTGQPGIQRGVMVKSVPKCEDAKPHLLPAWGPRRWVYIDRAANASLGIRITGGSVATLESSAEPVKGIFVRKILPGGLVAQNGQLQVGDRILEVNGHDLRDASFEEAVEVIRAAEGSLSLLVQGLEAPGCMMRFQHGSDGGQHLSPRRMSEDCRSEAESSVTIDTESEEPDEDDTLDEDSNVQVKTRIDRRSAANVRLPKDERHADSLEEDEFGYTPRKIQMKYAHLDGELLVVEVPKNGRSLGISLAGNKDRSKMSVLIAGLNPKGCAFQTGRLVVGDEILEANGIVLRGRSHLNASAIIKQLGTPYIKFIVLRKPGLDDLAVQPLKSYPMVRDYNIGADLSNFPSSRNVTLYKGNQGIGIMIIEGRHAELGQGIFISDIQDGSMAQQMGLCVGDMILSVNEESLLGVDYDDAVRILRNVEGRLVMRVCNPSDAASSRQPSPRPVSPCLAPVEDEKPDGRRRTPTPIPTIQAPDSNPSACPIVSEWETLIEINKEAHPLGISIVGGVNSPLRYILVNEIFSGSAAERDGRLRPGDVILEVCRENLRNATYEEAKFALANAQIQNRVQLLIYREKLENVYQEFEVNLMRKKEKGLGLTLSGLKGGKKVFICDVMEGSVASVAGELMRGDEIKAAGGRDLTCLGPEQVAIVLKTFSGPLPLTVRRLKKPKYSSAV